MQTFMDWAYAQWRRRAQTIELSTELHVFSKFAQEKLDTAVIQMDGTVLVINEDGDRELVRLRKPQEIEGQDGGVSINMGRTHNPNVRERNSAEIAITGGEGFP